ncbi:hypothetical protein CKO25_10510 [Thiocapsa imhoffii]|uniref:Acyltransferase n=1 Tax=Thiocapsa imhoffii TaxID=382777 RepID=A0A9X0WHZ0_9GAMM|nr:acyltransferase [Thiocapsa imhoffii]MBK1645076.1 hypothetical protein [Thiocapsa imhoffii]
MTRNESIAVASDYLRASWLRARGARLASKVRVGSRCEISRPKALEAGGRVVLEAQVVFKLVGNGAGVSLAEHVFIGRGTLFDLSGPLFIGEGTMLAPNCFVTDHNHGTSASVPMWRQSPLHAPVRIGADCWLGARAIVLPGVTIGDGAIVAAGAVVTADVAPSSIVCGVPARFMRLR